MQRKREDKPAAIPQAISSVMLLVLSIACFIIALMIVTSIVRVLFGFALAR